MKGILRLLLIVTSAANIISCDRGYDNHGESIIQLDIESIDSKSVDAALFLNWEKEYFAPGSDSSGIGLMSNIGKIIIRDSSYYILDPNRHNLLKFSLTGDIQNQIGRKGRGGDEYLTINDFGINDAGVITILDGQSDYFYQYDIDGSFIKKIPMNTEWGRVFFCNSGEVLLEREPWDDTPGLETSKLVVCDSTLSPIDVLAYYTDSYDNNFVFPYIGFNDYSGFISYVNPIDDIIYVLDSKGNRMKIVIDYGKEAVPDSFKIDIERNLQDIIASKSFLVNGVYLDENMIAITSFRKGSLVDWLITINDHKKYCLDDVGLRLIGASYDRLFFAIEQQEKADRVFNLPPHFIKEKESGNPVVLVLKKPIN